MTKNVYGQDTEKRLIKDSAIATHFERMRYYY